jgi:hypothetical protein
MPKKSDKIKKFLNNLEQIVIVSLNLEKIILSAKLIKINHVNKKQ